MKPVTSLARRFVLNFKERIEKFDIFELGNSVVIYYFLIFFVLPIAVYFKIPSKIVDWVLYYKVVLFRDGVLGYLLVGIASLIFGYQLKIPKITKSLGRFFGREWDPKRTLLVFSSLFLIGSSVKVLRILKGCYFYLADSCSSSSPFIGLIGFFGLFGLIALAVAFTYYFDLLKRNNLRYRLWRFIAWTAFTVEFIYGFFSGHRGYAIFPVIIYLIVKFYLNQRNYKQLIGIALLILIGIMPFLSFYRNQNDFHENYSGNVLGFIFDRSIGRIDQSQQISKVFLVKKFLNGESFLNLLMLTGPPKFIWKDKPLGMNNLSNEIGRRLGIFYPDDFQSKLAPTMIGEFFLNFGLIGVVLGMFFFGLILRFVFDSLLKNSETAPSAIMIYSLLWIQIMIGLENWLVVYAGLPRLLVILVIIHLFLTKKI